MRRAKAYALPFDVACRTEDFWRTEKYRRAKVGALFERRRAAKPAPKLFLAPALLFKQICFAFKPLSVSRRFAWLMG